MKNTIKIILLFTTIIVAIIVSMIIVAGPKDMKTIISFENIEKIEYANVAERVDFRELTKEEMAEFVNRIYNSKIKKRYFTIKQTNRIWYKIIYKDQSSVVFGNMYIEKVDKNGKIKQGFQYRLYWNGKYMKDNQWPE